MHTHDTNSHPMSEIKQRDPCCEELPLLQVTDLALSYGEKAVLSQVSLDIYKGCITALIGPSGCGKTSFLSTLNRLIDYDEQAIVTGQILFDGEELLNESINTLTLRRRMGMIFQRPNPFPLSIWRNLELPLKEHGVNNRSVRQQKIEQALKDVGLWYEVHNRLNDSALALSGGQQQRLCIARALVLEPEVLLMDEPCSALDPIASKVVEELIISLQGDYTIVIVTHNLAQARRIANYVGFFWMTEQVGQLIEFGQCQDLFEAPKQDLTSAYISGVMG